MGKKKIVLLICVCAFALAMLAGMVWIYLPSEASVVFYDPDLDVTIQENLSREETLQVKKILFGKIPWPEWLYGYPACGFGSMYAVVLDGMYYMPAWDSCGMVVVKNVSGDLAYINVNQHQKGILEEIIHSGD